MHCPVMPEHEPTGVLPVVGWPVEGIGWITERRIVIRSLPNRPRIHIEKLRILRTRQEVEVRHDEDRRLS